MENGAIFPGYFVLFDQSNRVCEENLLTGNKMLGLTLIVDDDRDLRLILRDHLEPEGFAVIDAANGAEIRAVIELQRVDLAILDLKLPDDDSLNLAKILREKTDARRRRMVPGLAL
jgi:CheY-like chemotaxis protein